MLIFYFFKGEQIGLSLLHDWAPAIIPLAKGINGTVLKKDFSGSFRNKAQLVDVHSHFVTAEQWAIVQSAITAMQTGNLLYLCGPYMAEFGPLDTKNGTCLAATSMIGEFISKAIVDHGNYTVPLTEIKFPRSSLIGLATASVFLALCTCALMAVVFLARHKESIRLGSYVFLLNMLVGTILVYAGVITWPLRPSGHSCLARIWLPSLGATIVIAALISKNLRIMIAFHYAKQVKKAGAALYLRRFVVILVAMVVINIAFLAAYTGVVPSGTRVEQGQDGLGKYEIRRVCASSTSSTHALYALLVFHGAQLLLGCVISYQCRIITDPKYDERKAVAFCIYGISFCLVVFAVLVGIIGLSND